MLPYLVGTFSLIVEVLNVFGVGPDRGYCTCRGARSGGLLKRRLSVRLSHFEVKLCTGHISVTLDPIEPKLCPEQDHDVELCDVRYFFIFLKKK